MTVVGNCLRPTPRASVKRAGSRLLRERAGPGLVEIAEEGVTFRSHLDGSRHFFSPERATEVQEALGPDVIMAFDECPPSLADRGYHELSLARTQRWLVRCRDAWRSIEDARGAAAASPQWSCALFGIAQGGLFPDLRARAIERGSLRLDQPVQDLLPAGVKLPEAARELFAAECPPETVRAMIESGEPYSRALWQKLVEQGWTGLIFPEESGGTGLPG